MTHADTSSSGTAPPPGNVSPQGSRSDRAAARRAEARLPYAPSPSTRWGTPTALITFLALIALLVVVELARSAQLLTGELGGMITWIIFDGGILLALAIVCSRFGSGSWVTDFGLRFRWFDVFIGLGSGIGIHLVAGMLTGVVEALMGEPTKSNIAPPSPELGWVIVNTIFAVAVVAPICEELLFRGLLLRGFRNTILRGRGAGAIRNGATSTPSTARRRTAAVVSVATSAILFAIVHLYEGWGSPVTMVSLGLTILVLGTVNGVYAATTKRLGPGIWTHMWFNGMTVALILAESGAR